MEIFWVKLDKIKYIDLFKEITKLNKQNIVFTPNPEILLKIREDKEFLDIINKADYLTSDGIWLFLAYQILDDKNTFLIIDILKLPYYIFNLFFKKKFLYEKYGDRICWSDLTMDLLCFAEEKKVEIVIIDLYNPSDKKKVESQKKFKQRLNEKFEDLKINYFIYKESDKEKIIEDIKKTNSKILFSTLGMKKQEKSVVEIMNKVDNLKLWLWVWSSFDNFTWLQKRAPEIFRYLWFEWLYRLFIWPNKIKRIKRIYNAVFVFTWKVLIYKRDLWRK